MNEISLLIKLIIFNLVIFFFWYLATFRSFQIIHFVVVKIVLTIWKEIHRIIYTEERLQKMNKSPNGGCHFCKDPENLIHLFVNCKLVDSVWTEIFQKMRRSFLFSRILSFFL
jgi:hypothetical protein